MTSTRLIWRGMLAILVACTVVACSDANQVTGADGAESPLSGPDSQVDENPQGEAPVDAPAPPLQMAFDKRPARVASGQIPLVLLHDFGLGRAAWASLTPLLNETRDVISFDLRGHGDSDKPVCCYTTPDFTTDLVNALDAQGLERVHLMGVGGGGLIAQQFASLYPGRTDRLILAATDATATDNPAWQALYWQAARLPATDEPADEAFLQAYNEGNTLGEISRQELVQMQRRVPSRVWAPMLANLAVGDLTGQLPDISAPALLIRGANDPVFTEASQARLARGLVREVSLINPVAGRFPTLVQAWAAARVNEFLAPRGTLHVQSDPFLVTAAQVDQLTSTGIERLLLREVTGDADCDIQIRNFSYQTEGGAGESSTATASVAVPSGSNPVCNGPRPLVLYAHGTSTDKNYDFTGSNEGFSGIAAAVFAARGYIVVAPNYTGYRDSWLGYHPYLNAKAQAADMIDALRAARTILAGDNRVSAKELFLTGYSQGGYVAMATQREMESKHADEFTVTASFPMSGPYSLEQTMLESLSGRNSDGVSRLLPFIADSWQNSYGNLYASTSELYEAPYDQTASGLFPGTMSASDTVQANLLPDRLLESQGSPWLLRSDWVAQVLSDASHPFRQAARLNTLTDWTPRAPMAMCGGGKDQTVFFDNTYRARDAFLARGVDVPYFDFNDSSTMPGGRTNTLYLRFRSIFLFRRNMEPYHAALAPYCARLARDFFSQYVR